MVFRFNQRGVPRQGTSPPSYEAEYVAAGIDDQQTVRAYAITHTAALVSLGDGVLYRQNIDVKDGGYGLYYVTVTYGPEQNQTGTFSFNFSTTGGSFHVRTSRSSVARYPNTAPDFKQLIGVHDNEVDGADIIIPALKMSYAFKHPQGVVNEAFAVALAKASGCVNESAWHGFSAGEVLFLGADGSDGTSAEAEVTYHVACEQNLQNHVIGAINGINKDGHDLLWVTWKDNSASGRPLKEPTGVYIERLYRRINLQSTLGF